MRSIAYLLPDEPGPVRLMNTIWADRHGVHDTLARPADLAAWLTAAGLTSGAPPVPDADARRCRDLRDALRRLAAWATADDRPAAASATWDVHGALAVVNAAVADGLTPPRILLDDGALHRADDPDGPAIPAALSQLAVEAIDLLTGAAGTRLRACHAPGCVLYFVKEHPRREWCSTACGNRSRAARHYRRHRSDQRGDEAGRP